MIDALEILLVL